MHRSCVMNDLLQKHRSDPTNLYVCNLPRNYESKVRKDECILFEHNAHG